MSIGRRSRRRSASDGRSCGPSAMLFCLRHQKQTRRRRDLKLEASRRRSKFRDVEMPLSRSSSIAACPKKARFLQLIAEAGQGGCSWGPIPANSDAVNSYTRNFGGRGGFVNPRRAAEHGQEFGCRQATTKLLT